MRRNLFPGLRLVSFQLIEMPHPVCQVFRSAFCRFRCALFVQQLGSLSRESELLTRDRIPYAVRLQRAHRKSAAGSYVENVALVVSPALVLIHGRSDQQLALVLFRQAPNPCAQLSATRSGSEGF